MAARNHNQWMAKPSLKQGEWIDSRVYTDEEIFEEELQKIFKNTWDTGVSRIGAARALRFPHDDDSA